MNRTKRMELAKWYGTVNFQGRKYWLTNQAQADNYGTNGDVRYYASAVDRGGKTYRVAWDTTEKWRAAQEQFALRMKLEYPASETEQTQNEYNAHVDNHGDLSYYSDDEANACDWDKPTTVEVC